MHDQPRNPFGDVIQQDSPRVPAGQNANPAEYFDKQGKTTPTPSCVSKDGITPKYAADGLTMEYAETPHVSPVPLSKLP
jgi:hypothetical protein